MTQKDKTLNCLNCRIGDFKHSLCDCHNGFCAKYKGIGTQEDFFMAIEALSTDVVPKHDVEIIIDEITKRTSSAEVEQGEWICKGDYAICSKCGGSSGTQYDGVERIPRITAFCPHCGVRMTKGGENE